MIRARSRPSAERAAAGANAHMGAQQSKRELARQQLVISEPRPGGALGRDIAGLLRAVDQAHRVGEIRIGVARQPLGVLPFRQHRQPRQREIHGFAHLVRAEPFGQRIDRIE